MKLQKILYWVTTLLLCLMMVMSTFFYLTNTEEVGKNFELLGYPAALVIPLAIAKLLAVIAILSNRSKLLKRLAYYGLGINFILALTAHLMAGDGQFGGAAIAIILLVGSYFYNQKVFARS
ncbi:MAG: DoxX family protein [Bacteroidota bacterium]